MIQRESNFELLRIMAAMGIIVLHFNFNPAGGGAVDLSSGLNFYLLMILEIFFACSVNIFILLSGYFSVNSEKTRTGKLLTLLLQTILFRFVISVIGCFIHNDWNIRPIIGSLLPANYYVILYIVLMFLAPFINKLINALKNDNLTKMLVVSFCAFSIYSTMVDVLKELLGIPLSGLSSVGIDGSMNGYTIVNFVLVYLIGAYFRKNDCFAKWNNLSLFACLAGLVFCVFVWRHYLPHTAWIYNNPLLIFEACIVFTVFRRIRLNSNIVNHLASAAFTCFLIHSGFLNFIDCESIVEKNPIIMLVLLALIVIGIFMISYIVMLVWNLFLKLTIKRKLDAMPVLSVD